MIIGNHSRYALLIHPGELELREESLPSSPPPDYVRLQVDYCGICGSDLEFFRGRREVVYPRTLGHEYSGTIVKLGENIRRFKVGDLVAVDPNYRCGECAYCKSGASNLCVFSSANLFTRRGFSDFVDIHHSYLHIMPNLSPNYIGALIEPLSCALHALQLSNIGKTDHTLVLGCGGQGTMIAMGLSMLYPDVHMEVYDPIQGKADRLASIFSSTIRSLADPPAEPKYSLVFEASGRSTGFKHATDAIEKGGRIIISSRYRDRKVYLPAEISRKECSITFSHLNGNGEPFLQAMDLLSTQWRNDFNSLFNIEAFETIDRVFSRLDSSTYNKTIIKIGEEF